MTHAEREECIRFLKKIADLLDTWRGDPHMVAAYETLRKLAYKHTVFLTETLNGAESVEGK